MSFPVHPLKLLKTYPGVVVPDNLMKGFASVGEGHRANLAEANAVTETGAGEFKVFAVKVDLESRATDSSSAEARGYHRTQLFTADHWCELAINDDALGPTGNVSLNDVNPIKLSAHAGTVVEVECVPKFINRDIKLPLTMRILSWVEHGEQIRGCR
ncbi:uncharacterized protein METZ01_LOCUS241503, partial [marine metagenome]